MENHPEIVLFGEEFWLSPYVYTIFVALKEKGLKFTTKDISLVNREQKDHEFINTSLTARVPSIKVGNFHLGESAAIIEYLDEKFPSHPLLPSDIEKRARARQVLHWIRTDLLQLREERDSSSIFYEGQRSTIKPFTPKGKEDADKLVRVAETLIPNDSGPIFGTWCIADADLAFMLHRLIANGDPVPDKVKKYAEAQWNRSSISEYAKHERKPYVPYS